MDVYFLRDIHTAATPYYGMGKYFLWDRYNFGLKTHFYTHNSMLQTMGIPTRKFGLLIESPTIVPRDYKIFERHKGLEKEFDAIFTPHDCILNKIPNAVFYPHAAAPWYGNRGGGKSRSRAV